MMKKYFINYILLVLFSSTLVNAQVKIGENIERIAPQALLELESTTKGLVIPRMTSAQRDAAFDQSTPVGTVIFNLDENKLQYFHQRIGRNGRRLNEKVWEGATDEIVVTSEGGTPTIEAPQAGQLYYDQENNRLYAFSALTQAWFPIGPSTNITGNSNTDRQTLSVSDLSDARTMTLAISNGNTVTLDFSSLDDSGTDSQMLTTSLNTNSLTIAISNGNSETVDLSSINTDAQNIDALAFDSATNSLTVGITGGTSQTISLADLANSGTDSQTLTASLDTNTLTIAISDGNTQTVNLSSLNTDAQNIDALAFDSSTNSLIVGITGGSSASVDLTALSRPTTLTQQLRVTNTLQVDGNIRMNGGLLDGNGAIGSIGQVLSSTGTQTKWINLSSGPQGPQGPVGPAGTAGNDGQDGGGFLVGAGAPTSSVISPTFYVNNVTGEEYFNNGGGATWTLLP